MAGFSRPSDACSSRAGDGRASERAWWPRLLRRRWVYRSPRCRRARKIRRPTKPGEFRLKFRFKFKGQAQVALRQAQDQDKAQTADHAQNQAQNSAQACPGNPDALGTSRVLPIDFSEYQQLGRMQYPDSLPLNDKEVVITFDDGPLPPYTDQGPRHPRRAMRQGDVLHGRRDGAFISRRPCAASMRKATPSAPTATIIRSASANCRSTRMHQEIDGGIADVSAAFGGDSRYLAPFFRIPGLERSDLLESELAERGLIIFSADVVADDWHRDITPAKIISLAMSRLEARGKGILLLHDIHPKDGGGVAGPAQQLKEQGFRIVQVVPSAAYEIAMARKPAARMLASAMPGELMIEDNDAARPIWPHAADDPTPDAVVLPVPDAAAFEPDADLADDSGAVRWPDIPQSAAAPPAPSRITRKGKHTKVAAHPERRKLDVARSADRKRAERDRRPEHSRAHARAGADGHHAGLMSRIQALAAEFSPAQTTR